MGSNDRPGADADDWLDGSDDDWALDDWADAPLSGHEPDDAPTDGWDEPERAAPRPDADADTDTDTDSGTDTDTDTGTDTDTDTDTGSATSIDAATAPAEDAAPDDWLDDWGPSRERPRPPPRPGQELNSPGRRLLHLEGDLGDRTPPPARPTRTPVAVIVIGILLLALGITILVLGLVG